MNASVSSKCHVPRYLLWRYWALVIRKLCSGQTICYDENRGVTDLTPQSQALSFQTDRRHTNQFKLKGEEEMKYFDFLRSLLLIKEDKINIPGRILFPNIDSAAQQFDFLNRYSNSRKCRGVNLARFGSC